MTTWVSQLIEAIISVFTNLGTAILEFIKEGFTTLFLEVGEGGAITGLSNLGIFTFVTTGISMVMGLTYVIYNLVKRHR